MAPVLNPLAQRVIETCGDLWLHPDITKVVDENISVVVSDRRDTKPGPGVACWSRVHVFVGEHYLMQEWNYRHCRAHHADAWHLAVHGIGAVQVQEDGTSLTVNVELLDGERKSRHADFIFKKKDLATTNLKGQRAIRILCLDDQKQELERAERATQKAGHHFVGVLMDGSKTLGEQLDSWKYDAIVSDLQFNPLQRGHNNYHVVGSEFPGGLLTAIEAHARNVPVILCTAMDGSDEADFHHGKRYAALYDSGLALPHLIVARKDWDHAIERIVEMYENQEQKTTSG